MSVETKNLQFQYNSDVAFSFPQIQLEKEENLLIVGQSGKGKTTLLHLLGGLLKPSAGIVRIDTTNLNELSQRKMDKFRGNNIGLIFQRSYFVKSLSVQDNLLLSQILAGRPENKKRIQEVLEQMQVAGKLHSFPSQLSIGEQQRVAIARAVINEPALLLADEPTSALDDDNAHRVVQLLKESSKQCGANLIVVTHDKRLKNEFEKHLEL